MVFSLLKIISLVPPLNMIEQILKEQRFGGKPRYLGPNLSRAETNLKSFGLQIWL